MKVKDLIALLSAVNQDAEVLIFDGEERGQYFFETIDTIVEKPFLKQRGRLSEYMGPVSVMEEPPAVVLKQRRLEEHRSPVYCNCPGCGRLPEPAAFCEVCEAEAEEEDMKNGVGNYAQI